MENNVLAIIIYGSSARSDADQYSDKDICAFVRDRVDISTQVKNTLAKEYDALPQDIAIYAESEFKAMLEVGSLFLWHLKLEGRVVFGKNYFESGIKDLKAFDKHQDELLYHRDLFKDVVSSMQTYRIVNEIDLAQLFTIARNTCMILAHKRGTFAFGRINAFVAANALYADLPFARQDYDCLVAWKLRFERGQYPEIKLPTINEYKKLHAKIKSLLDYAIIKTK